MHTAPITHIESPGPLVIASKWKTMFMGFAVIGVICFAAGLAMDSSRAWHNYIIGYFMFTGFALGGLFFAALHHAVNAQWAVIPRRIAEGFTSFLPVALILYAGIAAGLYMEGSLLYSWVGDHEFGPTKNAWLTREFFIIRDVFFLLLWIFFAKKLVGWSLAQDEGKNPELSKKMTHWSLGFIITFAFSFSIFSYDLMMSLEPKWFSTMFGVYCFAGIFQSSLALMTILFIRLRREELKGISTLSHVKDFGTLLFAFTVFMCYVGFSQFMLIWYANLPEEIFYFIKRIDNGWIVIALLVPLLKFVIPFFGLLGQGQKKNEKWLTFVCWVIIVGQFFDLVWMSLPTYSKTLVFPGWMEIGMLLGFAGIFGLTVSKFYSKHSIVAAGDPRAVQSANWRFWE